MNHSAWGRWLSRLFPKQGRTLRRLRRLPRLETLEERLAPAQDIWTGGPVGNTNFNWSNTANWSLDRAPLPGDDLVFNNTAIHRTSINDIGATAGVYPAYNSISIGASNYIISGKNALTNEIGLVGTISVAGSLGNTPVAGEPIISLNLLLEPPTATLQQTFTVNTGTTLDLSGQLIGMGGLNGANQTLTKTGGGTLELDGNNSAYTGTITLAQAGGIIDITNADALGTGAAVSGAPNAGITTVNTSSQLQVSNIVGGLSRNN